MADSLQTNSWTFRSIQSKEFDDKVSIPNELKHWDSELRDSSTLLNGSQALEDRKHESTTNHFEQGSSTRDISSNAPGWRRAAPKWLMKKMPKAQSFQQRSGDQSSSTAKKSTLPWHQKQNSLEPSQTRTFYSWILKKQSKQEDDPILGKGSKKSVNAVSINDWETPWESSMSSVTYVPGKKLPDRIEKISSVDSGHDHSWKRSNAGNMNMLRGEVQRVGELLKTEPGSFGSGKELFDENIKSLDAESTILDEEKNLFGEGILLSEEVDKLFDEENELFEEEHNTTFQETEESDETISETAFEDMCPGCVDNILLQMSKPSMVISDSFSTGTHIAYCEKKRYKSMLPCEEQRPMVTSGRVKRRIARFEQEL